MSKSVLTAGCIGVFSLVLLPAHVALAGSCGPCGSKAHAVKAPDIVDVAKKAGSFKTLTAALKASGLDKALRGKGPFTVFAPTDEAFKKLPKGTVDALLKDLPKLRSILKYHVVAGNVMAADVVKAKSVPTLLGQEAAISTKKGARIEEASIVKTDIKARNGVIHVIDRVLLPEPDIVDVAREAGSFKTLLAALDAAGLTDALRSAGPFTVFAPTDAAFAKLPEGTVEGLLKNPKKLRAILTYHVVPGRLLASDIGKLDTANSLQGSAITFRTSSPTTVNGASILKADILAANGVIHVIDTVITPAATGAGGGCGSTCK